MRLASYIQPSPPRQTHALSLRGLLQIFTITSLLLIGSCYGWAIRVVMVVVAALVCDAIAYRLASRAAGAKCAQDRRANHTPLRRYWHRSWLHTDQYTWGRPVIVALGVVCIFMFVHLFMMMSCRWQWLVVEYDAGAWPLRFALQSVYAALMLYLLAHVLVGLLPSSRLPQHGFAMLFLSLCMVTTAFYILFLF